MLTVSDNIRDWAAQLKAILRNLQTCSSVRRWNYPGSGIINFTGDYSWNPLSEGGRPIQANALAEYRCFSSLLSTLLGGQPNDTLAELKEAEQAVLAVIQQDDTHHYPQAGEIFDYAIAALDTHVGFLQRLYDASSGKVSVVPDTNALLFNPSLEDWRFADTPRFVIILLPTVLSELDALKISHRVESVRQKSERLINQFKEYRRRGRLTDGVTLVGGVSEIVASAIEPDFSQTLPWLDASNNDDRLLAGVIETMRQRSHSPVILVTRDINLQNKAEFARVPFIEPPPATAGNN